MFMKETASGGISGAPSPKDASTLGLRGVFLRRESTLSHMREQDKSKSWLFLSLTFQIFFVSFLKMYLFEKQRAHMSGGRGRGRESSSRRPAEHKP